MFFPPRYTIHPLLPLYIGIAVMMAPATQFAAERVALADFQTTLGWTNRVAREEFVDIGDGTNCLRIFPGRRRTELNGNAVWLNDVIEPDAGGGGATLASQDVAKVLMPLLRPPPDTRERRVNMRVMLDPGHGGEDGGASVDGKGLIEKDFTLDMARRIGVRLAAAGVVVGHTRTNDISLGLGERTDAAGKWKADAFVSLHANYAGNRSASGCETYIMPFAGYEPTSGNTQFSSAPRAGNGHDILNTALGYAIHSRLPGPRWDGDRGLRRARFQVLRQAPCPTALIEMGFLSNPVEARLLASGWYRDRLARAIADGLLDFARHLTLEPEEAPSTDVPKTGGDHPQGAS